jgi:hypothetical protein
MSVLLCRDGLLVAQQAAKERQSHSAARAYRCKAMPQVFETEGWRFEPVRARHYCSTAFASELPLLSSLPSHLNRTLTGHGLRRP